MSGNNTINPGKGINRSIGILNNVQTVQVRQRPEQPQISFDRILQDKINDYSSVKLSKHAELRLQSRNINLTQAQIDKLGHAVRKAEAKGIKDSLVILDNLAFVVNVKSKTVVTALNSSELKENVFTNIDGAVFA